MNLTSWIQQLLPRNLPVDTFQFMSDLHLEVCQQYLTFYIPRCALYLILAGDIGRLTDYNHYLSFLEKQCARFDLVFLVLGNHEFYGTSRKKGLKLAAALAHEPTLNDKLRILNRSRFDLEQSNVIILGCTLQSHITPESREIIEAKVQDFKRIENWTVDDYNAEHERDLSWLKNELNAIHQEQVRSNQPRRILIVSHYAPTTTDSSSPKDSAGLLGSAFGTDILTSRADNEGLLKGVKCWVFGHTHHTTEFTRQGVRVIANQRGYVFPGAPDNSQTEKAFWKMGKGSKEDSNHKFDVTRVINI